jgi:hypothetical protein
MNAGTYNIICEQGATFQRIITVVNADGTLPDYNTSTARMQVRPSVDSLVIIIELTTENGRITLLDNSITLNIIADDTTILVAGSYKYDLEIQTGADVIRLVQGEFKVSPEVTRENP